MSNKELEIVIDTITAADRRFTYNETLTLENVLEPEVISAYFAEKTVKKESLKDGTYQYTFDKETSTDSKTKRSNVAKAIHKSINDELSSQHKEVKLKDITKVINEKETGKKWPLQSHAKDSTLTFDQYKNETKIYYKKIPSAPMGYQVYLITETKNLKDKKVKIKIHEKEEKDKDDKNKSVFKILKTKDDTLPVKVFAKKEDTSTDTEVSDWIEIEVKEENGNKDGDHLFLYKEENENKIEVGIKKIQLRPKEDKIKTEGEDAHKSFEGWQEALYIREDETEEGKKAIEDAKARKTARDAEGENATIMAFDKEAVKRIYPSGKINAPKTAVIGQEIEYILDIKNTDTAKEEDKNNIRWSFYVKGESKTDKKSTYITSKSKSGLYTYAKTEVVDGKNKLTIVFDEALKGKKVQIEPFRGSPELSNSKSFVRTTTVEEAPEPKISKRETTSLWLTTQCESVKSPGTMIGKDFENYLKLETPGLLFPFRSVPQNYPGHYKTKHYKKYDYTLHEKNAATFGFPRGSDRIHAARDLYSKVNEHVYAIADGVVKASENFYMNTDVIVIEHDYEHIKGHNMIVRYGEVDKSTIEVKIGDKVKRGQKIAEVGQLIRDDGTNFQQPTGENRGMLHIEFYTGEEKGKTFKPGKVNTSEMLHAKSDSFSSGRSFKRRRDLFDPLKILDKMLKNSQKENLIK
ncbi:M23 family metallopeptidase [Aquimarina latercula]|uniref:M23 family metallopeptidase n=1 Tax=Aquimarina latercula TaxID=987 RepID=UPI0004216316|nr:M23 family metallopeptidase [Aquimarina latercula]